VRCKSAPGGSHSPVAEGNCVAVRRGGEQPEANLRSVANANPIRRGVAASLLVQGRSLESTDHAVVAAKAMIGRTVWLGMEREEGTRTEVGRPASVVNASGSQSLHGTDGAA